MQESEEKYLLLDTGYETEDGAKEIEVAANAFGDELPSHIKMSYFSVAQAAVICNTMALMNHQSDAGEEITIMEPDRSYKEAAVKRFTRNLRVEMGLDDNARRLDS